MYKKIFFTGVLFTIFLMPQNSVFADENKALVLEGQITALRSYIERLTLQLYPDSYKAMSHDEVRASINNGVQWLVNAQEQSGHFAYEYLPYEDSYLGGDNIVRQAGSLYALTEVARSSVTQDDQVIQTIENAIAYFEKLSPEHTYEGLDVRCLTKNEESNICMLGATSLALTAILGYVEAQPETINEYKNLIEGYVSFILASKKPDAGFLDEYRITIGFRSEKESSFSNGESLLALVRYYQYLPREDVKKVIDETFTYLENKEYETPLYLWITAALKDMQVLWPNERYVTYGEGFTNWRMVSLRRNHSTHRNYCASTEGLASAYSLLKGNTSEYFLLLLRKEIDFWNAKNIHLQIADTDTYRVSTENEQLVLNEVENMSQSKGGFLTADDELTQRIDFTQHCVSTYLQTLVDIDGQSL